MSSQLAGNDVTVSSSPEGLCDPNSLVYWERMEVLCGEHLCDVGFSGGFGAAVPGQAEGAPGHAAFLANWWQLPGEGAKRDKE